MRRIVENTLGVGRLTSEGEAWKGRRRMIAPGLHLQQVRDYDDIMARHARAMTERWHDGREANVEQEMDGLTLSIVTAALVRVGSAHTLQVGAFSDA